MKLTISDVTEISQVIAAIEKKIVDRSDRIKAVVLALHGDLGAGKTTLVQHLATAWGVGEAITSPTFVVMKRYTLGHQAPAEQLVHIDAYRLEDSSELHILHIADVLAEAKTVVCIEWAERVADILPADTIHLQINIEEDHSRTITIT